MAKKLWGSRFLKSTHPLADKFTSSISFDQRLAKYDCIGSIAHAKMLGKQKIIKPFEAQRIVQGLSSILKEVETGKFKFNPQAEDIHSDIQNKLKQRIGAAADKLHTARSRNDQIVLDVKMYALDALQDLIQKISILQKAVLTFAKNNQEVIIPAYTHLQPAQCVLLAHHLLAYLEMLERDKSRLCVAFGHTDEMPLGACALSGTSLAIDRFYVAKLLGFSKVTNNSIDSVSSRDFVLEILAALAILSVNLSRIAEDLIIWSTREFGFIDIDWAIATGSSIMPHKKNPDCLELIRASTGKIQGDLSSVLVLMKGLPLSYNRDMQMDKPPFFSAIDTAKETLVILELIFKKIKVKKNNIASKINDEALFSVDILEYLIKKGLSYRNAHDIVGKMVRDCLDKGKNISSLTLPELKRWSSEFDLRIKEILNAKDSVKLKTAFGGTAPKNVRKQINYWKKLLR